VKLNETTLNIQTTTLIVPVSVIIPCYCCADTICRAIDSVLAQTSLPAEVILVDDHSRDNTLSVIQVLEQEHKGWIRVLALNANVGSAGARNVGWDEARYPYIAFLDADDTWHPEKIQNHYEYMIKNNDVDVSGHQCNPLINGEKPLDIPKKPIVTEIRTVSLVFKSCFSTPTVMLKRNIPLRFNQSKRYAEDIFLWQQIAFIGLQIRRIESPLAYVHKALYGEGGLSAQLWRMEKGELCNFVDLYRIGNINSPLFFAATVFSLIKYVRRVIVSLSRCLIKKYFYW
jgi:glycosyltransferase involved in cell wall biosynthesis